MTIIIKDPSKPAPKIEVDLDGPQGNAFFLLGLARKLCKDMGEDPEPVVAQMKAGDYEHLVTTFDRFFGEWVDLYRSPPPVEPG